MKIDAVELTLFAWDDIPPTRYKPRDSENVLRPQQSRRCCASAPTMASRGTRSSARRPIRPRPTPARSSGSSSWCSSASTRSRARSCTPRCARASAIWACARSARGHRAVGPRGQGRRHAALSSGRLPSSFWPMPRASPRRAIAYAGRSAAVQGDGWKAYKIHPPHDPDEDIRVCEAVREAVGDDFTLMLDSTWTYPYPDALRVGRAIEGSVPLVRGPAQRRRYLRLRQVAGNSRSRSWPPISGGRIDTYPVWLTERATDYLRGDIPAKAG